MKTGTLSYRVIRVQPELYELQIMRKFGFFTNRESHNFNSLEDADEYIKKLQYKPEVVREGTIELLSLIHI